MSNRKVDIEQAHNAQINSGDGATIINIHASSPEAVEAIQTALNEGKQLESIVAQGVFHNLPFSRNPSFTGREQILEQIEKNLKQKDAAAITQPQAIHGLGGIGKTQIAIEYAYRHLNEYRYIFWVEAESDASFSKSFSQIASILNLPQASEKEKSLLIAAVRSWFENHQDCLLIFDNAEDVKSIQPYLPRTDSGQIIITTRAAAMAGVAKSVELDKMEPKPAVEFLLKRAGIIKSDRSQKKAAKEICHLLGYLPLAIDHAGAYIEETRCQLAEYKEYFEQKGANILADKRYASKNYNKTVATTWNISIDKLNDTNPAAVALLTASCYLAPDDIPINLFTEGHEYLPLSLTDIAKDNFLFNQALGDLQKYSLISRQQGGKTFSIHQLVQSVIHDSKSEKVHGEYLKSMIECLSNYLPDVTEISNWLVIESLLSHADYLFAITERHGVETERLTWLLNQFGHYLIQRADYARAESLFIREMEICEKTLGRNHRFVARCFNNLGEIYRETGRYAEAELHYKKALEIDENTLGKDHPIITTSLNNLVVLYTRQGRFTEATPLCNRTLEIDEKALGKDHVHVAGDLNNLAEIYRGTGHFSEAELHYKRAIEINEKSLGKSHPIVATVLNNLALCYVSQERATEAEQLFKRALEIHETVLGKDHPSVAIDLNNLAFIYFEQKRFEEAESIFQRALRIFESKLGPNHPNSVSVLESMAALYHEWGKKDMAAEYAKRVKKAKAKD